MPGRSVPGPSAPGRSAPGRRARAAALLFGCLLLALGPLPPPAAAETGPGTALSSPRAAPGEEITVSGDGWRPGALLMLLVCGQNMIGGTDSCANGEGRAVTTDSRGSFSTKLPVAAPPRPCPCVVHVAAVTGDRAADDTSFTVAGHPTAPLPRPPAGKLALLAAPRLRGDSGLLVRFGAPPSRRLVLTVGNLGAVPVKDPVLRVGAARGVHAPDWAERRWRGTVEPGGRARVELPVELPAGAHGDYRISVEHGGRTLATRPWAVERPWGVTVFWVLLALVVPTAVFRAGMAVVDRVRPRESPRTPTPPPPPPS
ncbi:neocarzinostatin apoprotein domain-containing protein [Streptomyces sp. NPDC020141]|uniref:neocarzinostatin apoprotein domain-containing protein n=1 Tax=Streptomyces sp. NPDC020141 TaxID=3365065 RepID=UPI0037A45000